MSDEKKTMDGIVRAIDRMGRVVIPKEYRDKLKVENEKDKFEIFFRNNEIVLKKYQPTCLFCGNLGPSASYMGENVCLECIEKLKDVGKNIE